MRRKTTVVLILFVMLGLVGQGAVDQESDVTATSDLSQVTGVQPVFSFVMSETSASEVSGNSVQKTENFGDSYEEDLRMSLEVANLFWEKHWSDYFTGKYTLPSALISYYGDNNPKCGNEIINGEDNAYYCIAEDYIAWDTLFLKRLYSDPQFGDSSTYLIIAHEWGHAIQARLNDSLVSVASELQADCFAGATIAGLVKDGDLYLEPGDRGEIFATLVEVADKYEWGSPSEHGSADQRIEAYQGGEKNGIRACLP